MLSEAQAFNKVQLARSRPQPKRTTRSPPLMRPKRARLGPRSGVPGTYMGSEQQPRQRQEPERSGASRSP